jgi:hypothetical protein
MNEKFDELAKGLAQSATRRQALKKFGLAAASALLACFGLSNKAEAKGCLPINSMCFPRHAVIKCCHGLSCNPVILEPYGLSYVCH